MFDIWLDIWLEILVSWPVYTGYNKPFEFKGEVKNFEQKQNNKQFV